MAAKLERASPMNTSNGSPNILNMSDQLKFLIPERHSRNFSPFIKNQLKTPNISPIIKSAESFLKKRDLKGRREKIGEKRRRSYSIYSSKKDNEIMEMTLSVKTVLKDLGLTQYSETFDKEEINLTAFFTLSDDDLESIGVDASARMKILEFINDFNTPKKQRKLESKNYLHRY